MGMAQTLGLQELLLSRLVRYRDLITTLYLERGIRRYTLVVKCPEKGKPFMQIHLICGCIADSYDNSETRNTSHALSPE